MATSCPPPQTMLPTESRERGSCGGEKRESGLHHSGRCLARPCRRQPPPLGSYQLPCRLPLQLDLGQSSLPRPCSHPQNTHISCTNSGNPGLPSPYRSGWLRNTQSQEKKKKSLVVMAADWCLESLLIVCGGESPQGQVTCMVISVIGQNRMLSIQLRLETYSGNCNC